MLRFTLYYVNIQMIVSQFQSFQAGETSLHTACERGHALNVSLLLKEGADVNIQDKVSYIWDYDH